MIHHHNHMKCNNNFQDLSVCVCACVKYVAILFSFFSIAFLSSTIFQIWNYHHSIIYFESSSTGGLPPPPKNILKTCTKLDPTTITKKKTIRVGLIRGPLSSSRSATFPGWTLPRLVIFWSNFLLLLRILLGAGYRVVSCCVVSDVVLYV